MEDTGFFNAGIGSVLNVNGRAEMDAGLMSGDLKVGGVACLRRTRNPIILAKYVMESTSHVLLCSEFADKLAEKIGLSIDCESFLTPEKKEKWIKYRNMFLSGKGFPHLNLNRRLIELYVDLFESYGTVGAVALDSRGNVAAASSTGGYWLKLPGRIGDTPIAGAGFYADNRGGAASATGIGEYIMRALLCYRAVDLMINGHSAEVSAKTVINLVTSLFGENTAGIITVDVRGRVGSFFNTQGMARGILAKNLGKPITRIWREA